MLNVMIDKPPMGNTTVQFDGELKDTYAIDIGGRLKRPVVDL